MGTWGSGDTDPLLPLPRLPAALRCVLLCRLCKISQKEQGEALAAALADSLWAAGEGREATVCLISAATHFVPTTDYKADNFTERVSKKTLSVNSFFKIFGLKILEKKKKNLINL